MKENSKAVSFKTFLRLSCFSLVIVLVCVACLTSSTYAWFSVAFDGSKSTLQTSGNCLLSVAVYREEEIEAIVEVDSNGVLNGCGTYEIELSLPKGSASGYLIISAGDREYYTDCLAASDTEDQTLSFTLSIQSEQSVVLKARWGVHAAESHVHNGDTLNIE